MPSMRKRLVGLAIMAMAGACFGDGKFCVIPANDVAKEAHHTRHAELYGKYAIGYGLQVLKGVDEVQKSAGDGGGYFIGVKARPAESPIGYAVKLFGTPLLAPPRGSSY